MRSISQELLKILIYDMSMKITDLSKITELFPKGQPTS